MEISDFTKDGLTTHFQQLAVGDAQQFANDLRELSPSRLKACCKELGISTAADKADTIKAIVKAVTGGKVATKGKPPVEAEAPPAKPEGETPEEKPAQEPKITSHVMPKGTRGPVVMLTVDERLKKLIPRPTAASKAITKASIKKAFEGGGTLSERIKVTEPKKAGDPYVVYDGHTRLEILNELKIPITEDLIEIVTLTPEQVEMEIFTLNVARRDLTDAQKLKLVEKYLPQIKKGAEDTRAAKKAAEKEAKEAERKAKKAAERAALKEKIAKANADSKAREKARKAKEKADKEAEKARLAAEKAAAKEKGKSTRGAVADAAGVSPAQVRVHEWLKKMVPDYLEEQTKAGVELGTIYSTAHDVWFKAVQKFSPDLVKEVKAGKISLQDAYEKAKENQPEPVRVPGPLENCVASCKDTYLKVLRKKYGEAMTPDEYEADYINRLDARITNYAKKEQ